MALFQEMLLKEIHPDVMAFNAVMNVGERGELPKRHAKKRVFLGELCGLVCSFLEGRVQQSLPRDVGSQFELSHFFNVFLFVILYGSITPLEWGRGWPHCFYQVLGQPGWKMVVSVGWFQTFTNGKWLEITKYPFQKSMFFSGTRII